MAQPIDIDYDTTENLLILNYAIRLMASMTDREVLLSNGIECIADFCHGMRSAILIWDQNRVCFIAERLFLNKEILHIRQKVFLPDILIGDVGVLSRATVRPCRLEGETPLPALPDSSEPHNCVCLPLVSTNHRFMGIVTIELNNGLHLASEEMQDLRMLMTVLAIALENASLFQQAVCDGLTGAYLRRFFEIRLDEELSKLKRKPDVFSILFLDIDQFKAANDRFGHQAGDGVLRELTQLLRANLRQGIDVVCRYGGDEFIILMPGAGPDESLAAAERICVLCSSRDFSFLQGEMSITLSGGLVSVDERGPLNADELFKRVDAALYQAKESGGNHIVVWLEGA